MIKGTHKKEIEFKYTANHISAYDFIVFCRKKMKKDYIEVHGEDRFYENKDYPDCFFRHRMGSCTNQLTFKKKLNKNNSFIRVEHNIDLDRRVSPNDIDSFCLDLNFKYNMTLRKKSFIFENKYFLAAYYICYNEEGEEVGRFIELELSEKINWINNKKALKSLKAIEKRFILLGIDSKKRIKRSLWEIYKK